MRYEISKELLQKITTYLLSCPAAQVYPLLKALEAIQPEPCVSEAPPVEQAAG